MYSNKDPFLVTLILGSLWIGCLGVLDRAEYGEECNALRKCNRRALLWCNSIGVCDCSKPQSMLFDPSASSAGGRCLVKIGEVCKIPLGENDSGQTTYQTLFCVSNGACSADGYCACNTGFYETANGTCNPLKKYLEDCDRQNPCNLALGLHCGTQGTCLCGQDAVFESKQGCLGLPGKACVGRKCLDNNTSCSEGTCVCKAGMYLDSGECLTKKTLNVSCTSDLECGKDGVTGMQLKCKDGICDCNATSVLGVASQRKYRHSSGNPQLMCAPIPGESCFEGYCSPSAYCAAQWDQNPYYDFDKRNRYVDYRDSRMPDAKCICSPTTSWSSISRRCLVPFGGSCSSSGQCFEGFACKRSKCDCEFAELEKDTSKKQCISVIGGACNTDVDCVNDSECVKTAEDVPGECACKQGFVETVDQHCIKAVGMSCSNDTECDPLANLECRDGKCACRNRALYSETERRCRGYVGSPCQVTDDDCIDGAECSRRHEKLKAVCRCRPGLVKTSSLTCELPRAVGISDAVISANTEAAFQATTDGVEISSSTDEYSTFKNNNFPHAFGAEDEYQIE